MRLAVDTFVVVVVVVAVFIDTIFSFVLH
jgi:hypothetical protein